MELHEDLAAHQTTRTGVWCGIHQVNGVDKITDMDVISQETLDELLLPAEASMLASLRRFRRVRRKKDA